MKDSFLLLHVLLLLFNQLLLLLRMLPVNFCLNILLLKLHHLENKPLSLSLSLSQDSNNHKK